MRKPVALFALTAVVGLAGGLTAADEKTDTHKGKQLAGKLFVKMDEDGDTKVSRSEFKKFVDAKLKDRARGEKAGEFLARLFDKVDENADGHLNREECAKLGEWLGDREKLKERLKGKFKGKKKEG